MIVVQTPLRISFLGGGTDFEGFYARHGGAVLSTGIDKCIFVIVKKRFDNLIYVNYTKKEIVESVDDIQHDLVREAMRITGVTKGVEITNLADIPTSGTGLGSSSSFTVALLQALHTYRGNIVTAETLAEQACQIEIDILGAPIGKQDQYIAAYGGVRFISFDQHGITAERIPMPNGSGRGLDDNLLLFYTGITRNANSILKEQEKNIDNQINLLKELRDLAHQGKNAIISSNLEEFGALMHRGWEAKKRMASQISNGPIDEAYAAARKAGAIGGKISGAGGGGFLLLYCPVKKQDSVRVALRHLREMPFHFEPDGSKVIFNYRRV